MLRILCFILCLVGQPWTAAACTCAPHSGSEACCCGAAGSEGELSACCGGEKKPARRVVCSDELCLERGCAQRCSARAEAAAAVVGEGKAAGRAARVADERQWRAEFAALGLGVFAGREGSGGLRTMNGGTWSAGPWRPAWARRAALCSWTI